MSKFIAWSIMIGFIVITTVSNFSQSDFFTPVESEPVEIVYDADKVEYEKSDEAIKTFDAKIDNLEILASQFDHSAYHSTELLQQLFKPPQTPSFS